MTYKDIIQPMDLDNYGNKTVKASCILLDQISNNAIKLSDTKNCLQTFLDDVLLTILEEDIFSMFRKIITPYDKNTSNTHMQAICASQLGYMCLCETPDQKSTGIIKHLFMLCLLSNIPEDKVLEVHNWLQSVLPYENCDTSHPILFARYIVGFYAGKFESLRTKLKQIHPLISVSYYKQIPRIIHVKNSPGKFLRLLFKLSGTLIDWNKVGKLFWEILFESGKTGLVEPDEQYMLKLGDICIMQTIKYILLWKSI
ncbi:hypothetical protein K7432_009912 [Basidiobolus ranarum]|uniref:DNA-directed RNA polymerase n=1 Tax=Basidiobolus ranarum TaxID=34480 RepID=A0ABR2WPK1_9FUNG